MGVIEGVVIGLAGFMIVLNIGAILIGIFLLYLIQRDLDEVKVPIKQLTERLGAQERVISSVYTMLYSLLGAFTAAPLGGQQQMPPIGNPRRRKGKMKYQTEDGEHEATSFSDLFKKLSDDPNYQDRIKPQDVDDLKQMFEDATDEEEEEEE